jgi:hypothetical protein
MASNEIPPFADAPTVMSALFFMFVLFAAIGGMAGMVYLVVGLIMGSA